MNAGRLLIVDDERVALRNLEHILKKAGHEVTATTSGSNALVLLQKLPFDLVLTDLKMEKMDGMQVLRRSRELAPDTEVIMITGYATLDSAVEAMKEGAFHYIAKPYRIEEVRQVVIEALKSTDQTREPRAARATRWFSGTGEDHHPGSRHAETT